MKSAQRAQYDIVITVSAELKAWIAEKAQRDHRSERGTVVYLLESAFEAEIAQALAHAKRIQTLYPDSTIMAEILQSAERPA